MTWTRGYPQTADDAADHMAIADDDWEDALIAKKPDIISQLPDSWSGDDYGDFLETARTTIVYEKMVRALLEYPDIKSIEEFEAFDNVSAFADAEVYAFLQLNWEMIYQGDEASSSYNMMQHWERKFKEALKDPRITIDKDILSEMRAKDIDTSQPIVPGYEIRYMR